VKSATNKRERKLISGRLTIISSLLLHKQRLEINAPHFAPVTQFIIGYSAKSPNVVYKGQIICLRGRHDHF